VRFTFLRIWYDLPMDETDKLVMQAVHLTALRPGQTPRSLTTALREVATTSRALLAAGKTDDLAAIRAASARVDTARARLAAAVRTAGGTVQPTGAMLS